MFIKNRSNSDEHTGMIFNLLTMNSYPGVLYILRIVKNKIFFSVDLIKIW